MTKYPVHEDFKHVSMKLSLNPLFLLASQPVTKLSYIVEKTGEDIVWERRRIQSFDGQRISVDLLSAKNETGKLPCLIFIHGGGFVFNAIGYHKTIAAMFAKQIPCKVVSVNYRLAPKYACPAAIEDCYAALSWVRENAENLQIDVDRIGVCGDSAGGNLAAALAQMARDKGIKLLFQILVCPALDARMKTESMNMFPDTPVWNAVLNAKMWKLYKRNTRPEDLIYASPAETENLKDLPPAFVEVNEFDCLRDEGIEYHERLLKAGVMSELNNTKRTIHGVELNFTSPITQDMIEKRIAFAKKMFYTLPL